MMERIKEIAEQEERVRILTLEGSRTNKNIQRDE
ncbi:aminoglycoside 6-adenylyltransferase [Salinicoccus halodurans]|nr:aminoglycoside 6-adenylyltransferase [Salinicoccus halodurans]